MKRTIVLSLVAVLSSASLAAAQPATDEPKPAGRVKVITIGEGEDIAGDVPTGQLVPIGIREMAKSGSLLRIRHDFIDMILKAAEDMS